jgi:hypothetical protein
MRRCAAAIVLLLRSSSTGVSAATEDGNNGEQLRGLQGPPPQRPCYAPDPTDPDYISKNLPPGWKPKNCEGTPIPNPGLNPDQNGAGGGGLLPPESNKENQLALSSVPAGCNVEAPNWIGDGYCDKGGNYNTPDCHFDGGDCCEETCEDNKYSCGAVGYDCKCGFRDGTNVKRTEFKFTSDADEGGALLADPLHNDIYVREGWLDQTSAPYLRKEGNPQQATNNTYTRREKCTLDVSEWYFEPPQERNCFCVSACSPHLFLPPLRLKSSASSKAMIPKNKTYQQQIALKLTFMKCVSKMLKLLLKYVQVQMTWKKALESI